MPALIAETLARISELPWYVGLPGLAVAGLFALSALRALIVLRPIKALSRLVLAGAVLIILSQAGAALSQLVGGTPPG